MAVPRARHSVTALGVTLLILLHFAPSDAFAACGERGGPGYRAPNGRCVEWAEIEKVCGNPPTTCAPEMVVNAPKAAVLGVQMLTPVLPPAMGALPDPNLTGGSVRTGDRQTACGHARESRGRMTAVRRDEVLRRYGLPTGTHPDYEIDHLIPLCLGGSDDPSNLWPQPRQGIKEKWNAEAKDRLERRLCDMVCAGQIDIAIAQQAFATDWVAAYHTYYEANNGRRRNKSSRSP
jgi:hypothetical protein